MNVSLDQLYVAYRKAKKEAFSDTNCAHGLKFLEYERSLSNNLARLRRLLNNRNSTWPSNLDFIGSVTCIPKSVEPPTPLDSDPLIHCQSSDPLDQWERRCTGGGRAIADFRPVIDATVDFMVVSALWILEVGHLYDAKLDTRHSVGNRLKRWRPEGDAAPGVPGRLNTLSPDLFQPYYTAYGKWRSAGLRTMRNDLERGHRIIAVTMDLKRFYHEVDAEFLLRAEYLNALDLALNDDQRNFTRDLINAFNTWNRAADQQFGCGVRGLPVGLTASGLIANVLLAEFDRHIVTQLAPSYYGRYVDDVFLVIRSEIRFPDGPAFINWLGEQLHPLVTATPTATADTTADEPTLYVNLTYGDGSRLRFVGKKQKIFQLQGAHGIDLIGPIEEQIRRLNSEYRDLPRLPDSESRMAHRALLVTPDATLEADSLRKADAVAVRRSGFALLLSDVEAHVRDLEPESWRPLRYQFYELVQRHLLTPSAFFDHSRYLPRIVGIMATCGDWERADAFILGFRPLLRTLRRTCNSESASFDLFLAEACLTIGKRMSEAVLQTSQSTNSQAARLLRRIRDILAPALAAQQRAGQIRELREGMLLLDWSRNSYAMHWLATDADATPPDRPRNSAVRSRLPFDAIRTFRRAAGLPKPHWPALAFPTRPIPLREITALAPSLLEDSEEFAMVVRGLRGSWMPEVTGLRVIRGGGNRPDRITIPHLLVWKPQVAITSIEVLDDEWAAAADGSPRLSLQRYRKLNAILDAVAKGRPKPDYVILPECSLPRRWAMNMAARLLNRGVSIIAGLEYRVERTNRNLLHNEALVALRTNFPGYYTSLVTLQPKRQPAWHERALLANNFGKALAPPPQSSLNHPIYRHQDFSFGILICSELTDIENRMQFQGKVDAVFVPEWNQDTESFSALVESAAMDVHAFIAQANNRRFGDSRMRAPMKLRYRRDIIRLKGGLNDYYVIGEIDYMALRRFQSHAAPPTNGDEMFKPFPVGFPHRLSPHRRTTPL